MSDFTGNNKSYISFDANSTKLMHELDEEFRRKALSMEAEEYHIPAMIDEDILKKCGYFSSFPQHLTIVAHPDKSAFTEISNCNQMKSHRIVPSSQYLTPAACLHIYPMLQSQTIEHKVITTKARVYRYENAQFDGISRLWDFTVREVVFIGEKQFVINALENMKHFAQDYSKFIHLESEIRIASDNFYPTKINSIKKKMQISNYLKYELVSKINGEDVALSSFNYHDTHFSKPFEFDQNGRIVTGCVGFGLERWVAAVKTIKGDFYDKTAD